MKTNSELKKQSLKQLKGQWVSAATAVIILLIPIILAEFIPFGSILTIIITGPLSIGSAMYFINLAKGKKSSLGLLSKGFDNFIDNVLLYIVFFIYIFLWSLLLIIPGIVKACSYGMAFYIKCDNPNMSANQVINASMKMMQGHKKQLFILWISFAGWMILSILTLGVGFLALVPYIATAQANFYLELKNNSEHVDCRWDHA